MTTTFTWDVARGLPVVLGDGSQYVYGAGLTAMKQSGAWFYYLADGLGSTMSIVDSSGSVQKGYTYDVYGKAIATGTLSNEFDFAGQQTDSTGLQYLRAPYMDPETGTFLSREPLAVRPGWGGNATSYGGANPVRFIDPTGLYLTEEGEGGNCVHDYCNHPYESTGGASWSELYYGTIVSIFRPLLVGEYHQAMVDCVRDTECRKAWDGFFEQVTNSGPGGIDEAVIEAAQASPWPRMAGAYVWVKRSFGFPAGQVWAAYKYTYGS